MSFKVDPDALDEFAQLLDGYHWDADHVHSYLGKEMELSPHQEGLVSKLLGGHSRVVSNMRERLREAYKIGSRSSTNMSITASQYRDADQSAEAKVDATYDSPKSYEADDRFGTPDKATFDYKDIDGQLKLDKKPNDLEPKASEMETWAREGLDELSIIAGVRKTLELICGIDVIDWLRQWWMGDWQAWARCALVWDACGDAVEVMGKNLWRAGPALDEAWDGNAADQADSYFEKLRDATYTEMDAYKALFGAYKWLTEAIYEIQQTMNDVTNTAVEAVITIFMAPVKGGALLTKIASNPDLVWKVFEGFGLLQTLLTAVLDIVSLVEVAVKAGDIQGVPACELQGLNGKGADDPAYHHPGEENWFKD